MFMLRTLVNQLIPASTTPADSTADGDAGAEQPLMELPTGQLWITANSKEAKNSCRFPKCRLSILSTRQPFTYRLLIQSDEDQENIEEQLLEEDGDDQVEFPIDAALQFRFDARAHGGSFCWQDPISKDQYEYRINQKTTNKHMVDFLETLVLECMFERKFRKSRSLATVADLDLLRYSSSTSEENTVQKETPVQKQEPVAPKTVVVAAGGSVLAKANGELFQFHHESQLFVAIAQNIRIELQETGKFQFNLVLVSNTTDQSIVGQPLESRMNPVFNETHHSLIWLFHDDENELVYTYSLKFASETEEQQFRSAFTQCMYEALNKEKFSKVNSEDQSYLMNAYREDIEMEDAFKSDDEEAEDEADATDDETASEASVSFKPKGGHSNNNEPKNSHLAVGYKHQRSFVVRGDRIGVFDHDHDDLKYATTINHVKTADGSVLTPSKIMLHREDSSMIMMDKNRPNRLFNLDIEAGKIVDEWDVTDNCELRDITHDTKYGQMFNQPTFVGVAHNAIFRVDTRLSGSKLAQNECIPYKTVSNFSCAATNDKGQIVVASEKGDLRMYDQLEDRKRAKTNLPGLGDPIIGIDVTADGKHVLATCKNYLLLSTTEAKFDDGVRSAFDKSLGDKKPAPRRLQLRPEHVAWINEPISFTPARFDTGANMEKTIVTSTGPYVIIWNFRRVKMGHVWDYTMKKYPSKVVADSFLYGNNRNVIVTLPDDVALTAKSQLMTPTKLMKQSLKETTVNSPY